MKNIGWRRYLLSALVLLFVIGVTAALFIFRNRISHIGLVGYPLVFVMAAMANATLILPLPGVALASVLGANTSFNPFWVAVVVGSGSSLGEMTGYLAGIGGRAVLENVEWYDRIKGWMRRYGGWTVLVLAVIPNPFFDLGGISAGALKMPVYKFLFWCCLGKILKMMMFAYGGAGIVKLFPWMVN